VRARRPLDGISVIELGGIGPTPFACGILADLGATIVRIEPPSGSGLPAGLEHIGLRDRIIVTLDAKDDGDRDVLSTMVSHADILIEGFRPGVAERLGLGPADVMPSNPGLVYVRMTGWGQTGPRSSMAGHDINYIGVTGVLAAIGDDEPVPPLNLLGDYGGGAMFAVVGALAGIVDRMRTGRGRVIDVAMVDGAAALVSPIRDLLNAGLWTERRRSNLLDGGAPFYRTYATSDGRAMAVGALEEPFYRTMVAGLGLDLDDLPDRMDPLNWDQLAARFAEAFASRTRDEWTSVFSGTDACVTPVLSLTEAVDDPHSISRRSYIAGDLGPRPAPAPRMDIEVDAERGAHPDRSPSDTLRALGCTDEAVQALEASGGIRSA
jgi:alpha-methylacyl-CoA racemase